MKYFLCCLGLAALPAFGQSREVAPVALFTHFQQRPSQAVFDAIRQEVASIVAPLGFPFEWRSLDDAQGNEAAAELAVVTFRGNCSIANLLTATTESGPLGITHITRGVVLPFAEGDCERVHDLPRNHVIRTPAEDREMVFGRAGAAFWHTSCSTSLRERRTTARVVWPSRPLGQPKSCPPGSSSMPGNSVCCAWA